MIERFKVLISDRESVDSNPTPITEPQKPTFLLNKDMHAGLEIARELQIHLLLDPNKFKWNRLNRLKVNTTTTTITNNNN